jgi:hypothetical protein
LHFKGAFVDAAVHDAIKSRAALVEERWRAEIRIARINRRAAGQQRMGECRATVVLERAEQRLGIDLVARRIESAYTAIGV